MGVQTSRAAAANPPCTYKKPGRVSVAAGLDLISVDRLWNQEPVAGAAGADGWIVKAPSAPAGK